MGEGIGLDMAEDREDYILNKDHLFYWLRQLRKTAELIAPKRELSGEITFTTVVNIHDIALNYTAPILSTKHILFPQTDIMFKYSLKVPGKVQSTFNARKKVVFGVPSCGISALLIGDRVFGNGYTDPYYFARRKNTIFVSIGCNNPLQTCFCYSLGTGPFLDHGFDIQLTDLGDRYFVQTGTDTGKTIIMQYRFLFDEADKEDYDDQYETMLTSQSKFEGRIDLELYRKKLENGQINEAFYEWTADRCFECGGCTYLCPLCLCFNIIDVEETAKSVTPEKSKDFLKTPSGERFRIWDSCMFAGFTKMAGGVNPHWNKKDRIKRWHYHKILYYPEKYNVFGCVGCGLCTITCPGKIDMANTVIRIKNL